MKRIAFVGKGNSDLIYRLFIDYRFQGKWDFTFAFSRDVSGRFNEYARRLGLIVIIENPKLSDWKKAFMQALEDFEPHVVFNFCEDVEIPVDNYKVEHFGQFVAIYNDKEAFLGDVVSAKTHVGRILHLYL